MADQIVLKTAGKATLPGAATGVIQNPLAMQKRRHGLTITRGLEPEAILTQALQAEPIRRLHPHAASGP